MKHRRSHHRRRSSKRSINNTFQQSASAVKSTSRRYMPKVKTGLENVGSSVIKTGEQSIPFLQRLTRKFFGMFSKNTNTKKRRRH